MSDAMSVDEELVSEYRDDDGGRHFVNDEDVDSLHTHNPLWLHFSDTHYRRSLESVTSELLQQTVGRLAIPTATAGLDRYENIAAIVYWFQDLAGAVERLDEHGLIELCSSRGRSHAESTLTGPSRCAMIAWIITDFLGSEISERLRIPESRVASGDDLLCNDDLLSEKLFGCFSLSARIAALRPLNVKALHSVISGLHPSRRVRSEGVLDAKEIIIRSLLKRCTELDMMTDLELMEDAMCWNPTYNLADDSGRIDLIKLLLRLEYGDAVIDALDVKRVSMPVESRIVEEVHGPEDYGRRVDPNWPKLVPEETILDCLNDYVHGTRWSNPPVCCVCSRSKIGLVYHVVNVNSEQFHMLDWVQLKAYGAAAAAMKDDKDLHVGLPAVFKDLLIDRRGIHVRPGDDDKSDADADVDVDVDICEDCRRTMAGKSLPRLSLANGLYRGKLPDEFADLTWVEEMVCCVYRTTAMVTRLYSSTDDTNNKILKGNTCAHQMNILSTAKVLPRAPDDVTGMLSVVFVGVGKPKAAALKKIFFVRKNKVWKFLQWLQKHNPLYAGVVLDKEKMDLYSDDDSLPGIEDRVVETNVDEADAEQLFQEETAGFTAHPGELMTEFRMDVDPGEPVDEENDTDTTLFLEKTGVFDAAGDGLPGRLLVASGLKNLLREKDRSAKTSGGSDPGIIIRRGKDAIPEYNNPTFFPGMYPTLFPYGLGGFERDDRRVRISFQSQAEYFFEIGDRAFRYHHSFIFVVLNIIQRRKGHLHTHFTVRRSRFEQVARKLTQLDRETIKRMSEYFENEDSLDSMNEEELNALILLKEVNTVASRVPGSQQSKVFSRNEIRSFMGFIGIPHLFLTLNPAAQHSPLFLVMYGDQVVDLTDRFPEMVHGPERARRLARDPVAASDFFDVSIQCIFEHLFGWDYQKKMSSDRGGILGRLAAFYGTAEYNDRGCLHGHFLIWLEGGMNPSEVHQKMKNDGEFKSRFFEFFEGMIKHDLPDIHLPGFEVDTFEPATQRPPEPPLSSVLNDPSPAAAKSLDDWDSVVATELRRCGEKLQRHSCRHVCHKYGNEGRCRFLFPHEIVDTSYYDEKDNSIVFLCRDATVNYYNPYILIFARHNHDIRCILSGRSAKAASFYITDYITKMTLNTNQMLSLLCKAVLRMPDDENRSLKDSAKMLLHKCLAQFQRQQQIHAQQAVRYIRGMGDSISSNETIPMMSNILMRCVRERYTSYKPSDRSEDCEEDDLPDEDGIEGAESAEDELFEDADEEQDITAAELGSDQVRVAIDDTGELIHTHQVDDYIYRDTRLSGYTFFEFVRQFELRKVDKRARNHCAGHYDLEEGHSLSATHEIVQRPKMKSRAIGSLGLIPRVVGMSIPRKTEGEAYALFVLAHHKPFSTEIDLLGPDEDPEEALQTYEFSQASRRIIENWEAIHECEDARDAEQLRKRDVASEESALMRCATKRWDGGIDKDDDDDDDDECLDMGGIIREKDQRAIEVMNRLFDAGYLNTKDVSVVPTRDTEAGQREPRIHHNQWLVDERFNPSQSIGTWDKEARSQEASMNRARQNLLNVDSQGSYDPGDTEVWDASLANAEQSEDRSKYYKIANTRLGSDGATGALEDPDNIIDRIAAGHTLNEKQKLVFRIAAKAFLEKHDERAMSPAELSSHLLETESNEPLRLLMTGPGGTGKTHAVLALKEFMAHYKSEHRLRLLAPTGSAAVLIGGQTCHKALSLKIRKKQEDEHGILRTHDGERYDVEISVRGRTELRTEWKNVDVHLRKLNYI